MELHASTQVSNTDPEEVAFLGRAGFRRVILERALSLEEIRVIRAASAPSGVELEVFVHGAICVSYSGRCFMSRATSLRNGNSGDVRSGNRGNCSQPCRLAYDLTDEAGRMLMKGKHLLSVCDMDLSAHIGGLLDAGVSSFKIEGRLKDVVYIRNVVSYYRSVLDEALVVRPGLQRASAGVSEVDFEPSPAKSFTRGGTGDYFFNGAVKGVGSFNTPKAMGEKIGFCDKQAPASLRSKPESSHTSKYAAARASSQASHLPVSDKNCYFSIGGGDGGLAAGDGICFFAGGELRGTNVNRVEGGRIYPNRIDGIEAGTEIFRNYDHSFTRAVERSRTRRRIGVSALIAVSETGVTVRFTDETGISVEVAREGAFEPARDGAKMAGVVREQLSRSGDTIFEVRDVEIEGVVSVGDSGGVAGMRSVEGVGVRFVPVSMLAEMRREGLGRLLEMRARVLPQRHPVVEDMSARFPRTKVTACENVVNHLAERFYRDHGVEEIERGLELRPKLDGEIVMRSRYCIRREIGECLKEGAKYRGGLFLERGEVRYRLGFECNRCEMIITKI